MPGDNGQKPEPGKVDDRYKAVITISINKEAASKLWFGPVAKNVLVDLLLQAIQIVAMKPNNVTVLPKSLPKRLGNWIGRKTGRFS